MKVLALKNFRTSYLYFYHSLIRFIEYIIIYCSKLINNFIPYLMEQFIWHAIYIFESKICVTI